MLSATLRQAREHRLGVYAMHFLHSLREALKRPEQTVELSIDQHAADLIRFFKEDYTKTHMSYAKSLMMQCLQNLTLSGASNRAASTVLAALAVNVPGMMSIITSRFLGLFETIEEKNNKNEVVGVLNALRKLWSSLVVSQEQHTIRLLVVKVLASLKSNSSEIQTATLELIQCIVLETSVDMLNFQPLLFESEQADAKDDKNEFAIQTDLMSGLNESMISRCNSVNSLVESEVSLSQSVSTIESTDTDEADKMSNQSGSITPTDCQNYVEMDPLFQTGSPMSNYFMDKQFENEVSVADMSTEQIEGFLCADLPTCSCPSNSDFYFYSSTLVAGKFLLTGQVGELRPDSEVRTSIKIQALKYLAVVGLVYDELTSVTVCVKDDYRQKISDLYQLLSSDDEGLSMAAYCLFVNVENTYYKSGQRAPTSFCSSSRFLSLTGSLLRNANPRRLKETLQTLTSNIELVMSDEQLFSTVCESTLECTDCDYFLLKVIRAEFFAKISWNRLSPQLVALYQPLCLASFCRLSFDKDHRVVRAVMDNFQSLVANAAFGFISDVFHVHWNEDLFLPSFEHFSQIFALHPNYSFRGHSPDLFLEGNLCEILETLAKQYLTMPAERVAGYVNALLVLARCYPPAVFNSAWGCLNRSSHSHSLLEKLIEIADSFTTTLSQLVQVLKLIGLVFAGINENKFINGTNRTESKHSGASLHNQELLDKLLILHLQLLNLYYTIVKESTTPRSAASSIKLPLFSKMNWTFNTNQKRSQSRNISNLAGTGIKSYKFSTSFLNSPSLCSLEPLIRGSFSNFMSSVRSDVEERVFAPMKAALDGLSCILEMVPRETLILFVDELLLYTRLATNLTLSSATCLLTQMLKVFFCNNAMHINANLTVFLKVHYSVRPTEHLEMLIGRALDNFSVYVAFLDRFEQMNLHKIRHIGWANKSVISSSESSKKTDFEIKAYLEQFEDSVAYLLQTYLNISDVETRCSILKLICVLLMNDVRYDKLDPNNRVLNSVLASVSRERLKNDNSIGTMFTFLCVVARHMTTLTFNDVVELVCNCVERLDFTDKEDAENVLNAIHAVLIEAIAFYSMMPRNLIKLLAFADKSLFGCSPAKTVELWTAVLHWARSTKTNLLWQQLSADFVDSAFAFVARVELSKYSYKFKFHLAHSLLISLKICNPTVFQPINQLLETFLNISQSDLFLSIPFALTFLFRVDQEDAKMYLVGVDQNALQTIGRSFATMFLQKTLALFKVVDKTQLACLNDGLAFFGIMLLHILQSKVTCGTKFSTIISDSFCSMLVKSEQFKQLMLALDKIAHLHPKIYAVWILVIFRLELFDDIGQAMFCSSLPFHAKQLVSLLFLQYLCDKRSAINDVVSQLLSAMPEKFLTLMLKMARSNQLELLNERLSTENVGHLVEKVRFYLALCPTTKTFDPSIGFIHKSEESAVLPVEYLDKTSSPTQVQSRILTAELQEASEKTVEDLKVPKTYVDICLYLVKTATCADDILCLAKLAVNLESEQLRLILVSTKPKWRSIFLKALFKSLNEQIRAINNSAYVLEQQPDFTPVLDLCKSLVDVLDDAGCLSSANCCQILLGLRKLPRQTECFEQISISSLDRLLNLVFIRRLMEAEILEINRDFYDALTELFRRSKMDDYYLNDYHTIEHFCLVLRLILDNIEKMSCLEKINRNHWHVELTTDCTEAERFKDEILESFFLVQRAAYVFLKHQHHDQRLCESAKCATLSIIRLPVFSKMFVVPKIALNRDWKLEIVGCKDGIKIELIQIHMLNDSEIIFDFVQRILCLGWTCKTQFETWFMTLLGVLCAIPSNDESGGKGVQKASDYIATGSIAIDAITNLMIQSVLYVQPRELISTSVYVVKPKQDCDAYLFLQSTNGKHATVGRAHVEFSLKPQTIYTQKKKQDELSKQFYSLDSKPFYHLWAMLGDLDAGRVRARLSECAIQSRIQLDISSSLKALFENFLHWFRNGINKLPLPLLLATIRSVAFLSDMFDDVALHVSVYKEMRKLLNQHFIMDHPVYGYAIYSLLKCTAVVDLVRIADFNPSWLLKHELDPRSSPADICRSLDDYIKSGLSSTLLFVQSATLHGVLYLFQSLNVDYLRATFASVSSFVLKKLQNLSLKVDALNAGKIESTVYYRLLFNVAFRLAEQNDFNSEFVRGFVKLTQSLFVDARLPSWQRSILTDGIQTLVVSSAVYCEAFKDIAVELFDTYQLRPLHLPYALSVYISCVYRMVQNENLYEAGQTTSFQLDLQKLLNVFSFYTVYKYTHNFLPTIAHLMFVLLKKEQLFEMLLSTIPMNFKNSNVLLLSDYDRCMLFLFYHVLHTIFTHKQQEIIDFVFEHIFSKLPIGNRLTRLSIYVNLVIMCALTSDPRINSLIYIILRQNVTTPTVLRACYLQAKETIQKTAEMYGFTVDKRNFLLDSMFENEDIFEQ